MCTLDSIIAAFDKWAPPSSAESYDNVGLQLGRRSAEIRRALVALDLTPEVVSEAVALGANLIVTHHPPIFNPVRAIRDDDLVGAMLLQLAEHRIALFAAHTNLDSALGGVSFALADALGLQEVRLLAPQSGTSVKIVTFVPRDSAEAVHEAMAVAGAGQIGEYSACAFQGAGTGLFRPGDKANPTIGVAGKLERVDELRLEMIADKHLVRDVLAAMKSVHPYEEVAHDIVPLENQSTRTGMGAVGTLPDRMPLAEFVQHVSKQLSAAAVRYAGDDDLAVSRVAVCGGSGSSLIRRAQARGADAFVTGDVSYHRFFESTDPEGRVGMAIIDAGHYETERPVEATIVARMQAECPSVEWTQTSCRTSPVRAG